MANEGEIHVGVCRALVDAAEEKGRLGLEPTLRDRFAMAALQGLLHDTEERDRQHAPMAHQEPELIAHEAYTLADAMMRARAKPIDSELAHSLEDRLFVDALTEIAKTDNAQGELARTALKSRELNFSRWRS